MLKSIRKLWKSFYCCSRSRTTMDRGSFGKIMGQFIMLTLEGSGLVWTILMSWTGLRRVQTEIISRTVGDGCARSLCKWPPVWVGQLLESMYYWRIEQVDQNYVTGLLEVWPIDALLYWSAKKRQLTIERFSVSTSDTQKGNYSN